MRTIATPPMTLEPLATVEADNQRSIRLLDRLGFRLATVHELDGRSLSATERIYVR